MTHRSPRANLPAPLPANVVPIAALDSLMVLFRDTQDTVLVMSTETRSSARFDRALADGMLAYEGDDASHPRHVPLTHDEVEAIRRIEHLARDWDAAVETGNRDELIRIVACLRAVRRPDWLEIEFVMPPRAKAA